MFGCYDGIHKEHLFLFSHRFLFFWRKLACRLPGYGAWLWEVGMEGLKMEYAMEIIQQKVMKAEEQRCLRRRQVFWRLMLSLALLVLVGVKVKGFLPADILAHQRDSSVLGGSIWGFSQGDPARLREAAEDFSEDSEEPVSAPQPHYASIRVERGDSLWGIASRYAAQSPMDVRGYVEELKRINQLPDDTIHAGHYLMVVYYK